MLSWDVNRESTLYRKEILSIKSKKPFPKNRAFDNFDGSTVHMV